MNVTVQFLYRGWAIPARKPHHAVLGHRLHLFFSSIPFLPIIIFYSSLLWCSVGVICVEQATTGGSV